MNSSLLYIATSPSSFLPTSFPATSTKSLPLSSSLIQFKEPLTSYHDENLSTNHDDPNRFHVFTHSLISLTKMLSFLRGNSEKAYLYGIIGLLVGLISLMFVVIFLLRTKLKHAKSTSGNSIRPTGLSSSNVDSNNNNNDHPSKSLGRKKKMEGTSTHKKQKQTANKNFQDNRGGRTHPDATNSDIGGRSLQRAPSGGWTFHEGCPPQKSSSPQSITSSPMFPGWGTNVFVHVESPNESPVLGSIPKHSSIPEQQQQQLQQQQQQLQQPQQLILQHELHHHQVVEHSQNDIQRYTIKQQQQRIIMQHTSMHQFHTPRHLQQMPNSNYSIEQQRDVISQYKSPTKEAHLKLLIPSANVHLHSQESNDFLSLQQNPRPICPESKINVPDQQMVRLQKNQHYHTFSKNIDSNNSKHALNGNQSQKQNYLIPNRQNKEEVLCQEHHKQRQNPPEQRFHRQNTPQHQQLQQLQQQQQHSPTMILQNVPQYYNQPVPPARTTSENIRYDDYYNMRDNNIVDNNNNDYLNNNNNVDEHNTNNNNNCDSESIVWIRRSSIKLTTDPERHDLLVQTTSFSPPPITLPLRNLSSRNSPMSKFSSPVNTPTGSSNTPPNVAQQNIGKCSDNVSVTLKNNFHNVRRNLSSTGNYLKSATISEKNKNVLLKSASVNQCQPNSSSPVQYRLLSHYPTRSPKKNHILLSNNQGQNESDCYQSGIDDSCDDRDVDKKGEVC